MNKRVHTNYRCADVSNWSVDGIPHCNCGGAEWRDGAWWCTHEHGYYAPDYAHERCGNAILDDGQIKMNI